MPRNVRCISLIAIAAKCDVDRRLSKETSIELNFKGRGIQKYKEITKEERKKRRMEKAIKGGRRRRRKVKEEW